MAYGKFFLSKELPQKLRGQEQLWTWQLTDIHDLYCGISLCIIRTPQGSMMPRTSVPCSGTLGRSVCKTGLFKFSQWNRSRWVQLASGRV